MGKLHLCSADIRLENVCRIPKELCKRKANERNRSHNRKGEKKWRNMKIGEALYQLKTENSFKYISIDNTSLSFADCIEMPSADAKAALELCLCVYVKKMVIVVGSRVKVFWQTNANERKKINGSNLPRKDCMLMLCRIQSQVVRRYRPKHIDTDTRSTLYSICVISNQNSISISEVCEMS